MAGVKLPSPARLFEPLRQKLIVTSTRFPSLGRLLDGPKNRLALSAAGLRPEPIKRHAERQSGALSQAAMRGERAVQRRLDIKAQRLAKAGQLLDAFSYQGVLARGYALVQNERGDVVRSKDTVSAGEGVTLTFADGKRGAVIDGTASAPTKKAKPKAKPKPAKPKPETPQGDLF